MELRHTRLAAAASVLLAMGAVNAAVQVHVVQDNPTSMDASVVPSAALPSADFISADVDYNVPDSEGDSLATFLNNPTFINKHNGFDPTQPANNTFISISASNYLNAGNNSLVLGHDDGVVLTFASPQIGTVVNQPGPTGFADRPLNIVAPAAGVYAFNLQYTECCGGSANLVFSINGAPVGATGGTVTPPPTSTTTMTSAPEPASFALLGSFLATLVLRRRPRR